VAMESLIVRMLAKHPAARPSLDEILATLIGLRAAVDAADVPEMPEIEFHTELDIDDAIAELEREQAHALLTAVAPRAPICGEAPVARGKLRWTPPFGAPEASGQLRPRNFASR
jgi:hypothetical protein